MQIKLKLACKGYLTHSELCPWQLSGQNQLIQYWITAYVMFQILASGLSLLIGSTLPAPLIS